LGAAVSAYVDGRRVVHLWGGWADADRTRQWQPDTIACTFSATKGITATCALRLVERGLLDLDAPVATYWPQFAHAGKGEITVRMVLSHQSGLPWATVPYPTDMRFDWATATDALARSAPVLEPGSRTAYHGGSFGYLVGEVLRRIDGRSLDTFFQEEIGGPLAADFMFRLGPEHDHRCAEMTGPEDMVGGSNSREWRAAGDGSATSFTTADGLARVYAALARGGELDGVRVLRPETIDAAIQEQALANGDGTTGDFGLGYQLLWKVYPGLPTRTFGHSGVGGCIGLADPTARLGFGFVMNHMGSNGAAHLLSALYRSLGP
ncbi:MAG TPA: serine hydrolase domain-containing protein, partial [Tepidiformaceae bacterium]|nr:serine hydrolase domain-containing protein [Tepidiformaceae bacterium]